MILADKQWELIPIQHGADTVGRAEKCAPYWYVPELGTLCIDTKVLRGDIQNKLQTLNKSKTLSVTA
jgi:hypothetical protein